MEVAKYINSKEYEYEFTKQSDGNILWKGPFENCKFSPTSK